MAVTITNWSESLTIGSPSVGGDVQMREVQFGFYEACSRPVRGYVRPSQQSLFR